MIVINTQRIINESRRDLLLSRLEKMTNIRKAIDDMIDRHRDMVIKAEGQWDKEMTDKYGKKMFGIDIWKLSPSNVDANENDILEIKRRKVFTIIRKIKHELLIADFADAVINLTDWDTTHDTRRAIQNLIENLKK